ncbi:MAG: Coenzyme F420 hydrogenase/dehydrogenase, beta subunit C-terminal domain [candidate division WOR-3 bacterium]
MKGMLKVKDKNPSATLRELCRQWLRENRLSGILMPAYSKSGTATMALASDPARMDDAAPLLPAMAVNAASIVAEIAREPAPNAQVGLLLRPCELRAVVELEKLKQVLPDSIVLIGIDCPGTYKAAGFRNLRAGDEEFDNKHVRDQAGWAENVNFRTACQMCEFPRPLVFDLAIGYIGLNPDKELWLEAATNKGKALLEGVELEPSEEPEARKKALETLSTKRKAQTEARLGQLDKEMMGPEKLVRYFADCLNCHNCMRVCPVCYCRECFFDSDTFQRDLGEHVRVSMRKGMTRMPSETLLFHITRMNHMMTSCVQCGICEDSCPVTVGLATLFKKVSQNAQKEFDYLSGRSLEEPLPLTMFREQEFTRVGEE